jgi:hypothetical protein
MQCSNDSERLLLLPKPTSLCHHRLRSPSDIIVVYFEGLEYFKVGTTFISGLVTRSETPLLPPGEECGGMKYSTFFAHSYSKGRSVKTLTILL